MKISGNCKKLANIRYRRGLKEDPERYQKYLENMRKYNNIRRYQVTYRGKYVDLMRKEAILQYEHDIDTYISMLELQIIWRFKHEKEDIL